MMAAHGIRFQALCRLMLALIVAAVATFATAPGSAADAPGFFRDAVPQPRMAGEGEYRWFGLKLYDARLWVGAEGYRPSMPHNAPFALELAYARSFKGARIADASLKEIGKLGLGTEAQRTAWLEAMEKVFPDVEDGSRIVGVYIPNQGVRFYLDGRAIGTIDDAEFSRAFFSIWLAERTSAKDLRTALLRNAAPQ